VRIAAAKSDSDIAAARRLFLDYAASLPFDLGFQGFESELAALPAPYVEPSGCLLLAAARRRPMGVVGLKRLADGVAEVKRLYVVPGARGSGLGKALLGRALDEARRRGYAYVRLDSHRASMAAAIALYRAFGFVEIAPYGPDLGGQLAFFEKPLAP
jgi:ribosomal protein S18 acetylase RimI-like enzyme